MPTWFFIITAVPPLQVRILAIAIKRYAAAGFARHGDFEDRLSSTGIPSGWQEVWKNLNKMRRAVSAAGIGRDG